MTAVAPEPKEDLSPKQEDAAAEVVDLGGLINGAEPERALSDGGLAEDLVQYERESTEEQGEERVMSVVDHLDELRARIIKCLLAFFVALSLSGFFGKTIIAWLEAPAGDVQFQSLSIEEPLFVYFKVVFYAAMVLVSPYLLLEIAAFIGPGLKPSEQRVLSPIVFGGPLLFVIGALFAYYFVLPPMLGFFSAFSVGIAPVHQRLDFYISLVTTMLLYMGLCFQLPIVLFALSFTGVVDSKKLMQAWRYAVTASAIVAAVITPDPTVFSMLVVMAALVLLYFLTVALLRAFGR